MRGLCIGELLGEGRAFAEDRSFPVDHVNGDYEDEGDAEEDCGGVGKGSRRGGSDV